MTKCKDLSSSSPSRTSNRNLTIGIMLTLPEHYRKCFKNPTPACQILTHEEQMVETSLRCQAPQGDRFGKRKIG